MPRGVRTHAQLAGIEAIENGAEQERGERGTVGVGVLGQDFPDDVFGDDFESGDLGAWTPTSGE